jgi:pSer/pThr/pTyr-binding forkhead associated (FHA) protein
MSDSLLNIFKFALLALLYLFFARVLWAVWSEVRGPSKAPAPARPATRPVANGQPQPQAIKSKPARGRKGSVARLIVIEPRASKGTAIGLTQEVTFGRAPGCTVSVPDDTFVSQVHARVFNDHGNIIIEDIGSTNGTYLNGNRLTTATALHRGDRIQIGSTVLEAN